MSSQWKCHTSSPVIRDSAAAESSRPTPIHSFFLRPGFFSSRLESGAGRNSTAVSQSGSWRQGDRDTGEEEGEEREEEEGDVKIMSRWQSALSGGLVDLFVLVLQSNSTLLVNWV